MTHVHTPPWSKRIEEAQEHTHDTIGGVKYTRIAYGLDYPDAKTRCRDCGVAHGQLHVVGCCVERCPRCKDQAIGCGCDEAGEYLLQ